MGEKEKSAEIIINKILQDVRDDVDFLGILSDKEKKQWNNPEERLELYQNNKYKMEMDAERWPIAIASYRKYKALFPDSLKSSEQGYYFVSADNYVYYHKKDGTDIKLSADLLTNAGEIKEAAEQFKESLNDEEQKIVNAFYRVSYTIGNFCPVWMNRGGRKGNDTCWSKLASHTMDIDKPIDPAIGLDHIEDVNELNNRHAADLFMILPSITDPREAMRSLYFVDYFDENWKLIWGSEPAPENNVLKMNREQLFNFIKITTILIIQRSYRIITNYTDDELDDEGRGIIAVVLEKIGMITSCICSKKELGKSLDESVID